MKSLAPDLVNKMEHRARRAFSRFDSGKKDHVTRISDVTATSCLYRLTHKPGGAAYSGPKLTITRTADGSIVVPKAYGNPVLDLLTKADLEELKEHEGLVRAYKATTKDAKGPTYPKIVYEVGKDYEEKDADTSKSRDCSNGINLADLDWCGRNKPADGRVFVAEFEAQKDLAAIPNNSDGKIRVFRCKIVEELSIGRDGKPVPKPIAQPPIPTVTKGPAPATTSSQPDDGPKSLPIIKAEAKLQPQEGLLGKLAKKLKRKKK